MAGGGLGLGITFGLVALVLLRRQRLATSTGGGKAPSLLANLPGARHVFSRRFKSLRWVRRRFNPSFLLPGYDPDAHYDGEEEEEEEGRGAGGDRGGRAAPPSIDPRVATAVAQRIEQWAADKDIYEMLNSLESLGLQAQPAEAQPEAADLDEEQQGAGGGGEGVTREGGVASPVMPPGPLVRETATMAQLAAAYESARRSLGWESVADLPDEKRAVASELSRAIASAYEAERIVLEETERVAREDDDDL